MLCILHLSLKSVSFYGSDHTTQVLEGRRRDYENEDLGRIVEEDLIRDLLKNLNLHNSMGPDEIYLRVLKELAN